MVIKTQKKETTQTNQLLDGINAMIKKADKLNATHIHIDPHDQKVVIRYRVANELQLGTKLPINISDDLVRTLKKLASLDVKDYRRPQEGSFNLTVDNKKHAIHIETMPVISGEKVVLHIQSNQSPYPTLESLGYWGSNLEKLHLIITKMRGTIIIAGTDASATSLTLYGLINILNRPPLKLGIIEGLASYKINGITQVEVNTAFGAPYIKELNQLDKNGVNVALISNLPSQQVTTAALRFSKNRIVCAGLSSINAMSASYNLLKTDMRPEITMARLQAVVGQTLFKKLCPNCGQLLPIKNKEKELIDKLINPISIETFNRLKLSAVDNRLGSASKTLSGSDPAKFVWSANKLGCENCNHTGYQDHVMLTELFDLSSPTVKSKLSHPNMKLASIEKIALDGGMIPQTIDGLIKCFVGLIDFNDLISFAELA